MGFHVVISVPTLILLLALAATGTAAYAEQPSQDPLTELSLEQLANLEVTTVSKRPESVWQSAAAVFVLTREDIQRSGATTLPALLRLIPGVQVSQIDSDHWAIAVRGLADVFSKSLLVLIDGRSVYTPLFGGVYWQEHDTFIEDIDRIEVVRGPGGTIWGANAVNGVINVITRHSRDTAGSLVSVGGGNVDQGLVSVRYGVRHSDALSYRVYAKGALRDAESSPDEHPYDDWRRAQAGFRVDLNGGNGNTFTLDGAIYKGSAGERVSASFFVPPSARFIEGSDQISGGHIRGRWDRTLGGDNGDFRLQAYVDRTSRDAIHFGESRNTLDVDFVYHKRFGGRHDVSLGSGARVSPSDFTSKLQTLSFIPEDHTFRLFSLFVQDDVELVQNRLRLTVGSKFEHNNYSGLEVQPSVRLLWRRSQREAFWTAITRAVRIPSRIDVDLQLYQFASTPPPAYGFAAGSKDYEAEPLIGTEAGYRRLLTPTLYVDVAAFHNAYDKLSGLGPFALSVQLSPIPFIQAGANLTNAIRGTTDGFEIAPDWRPTPWWNLRASYAFLSADMENRPGFVDVARVSQYEGSSPTHQTSIHSAIDLPRRFEWDQAFRFVSALPDRGIERYSTADVRLGWRATDEVTLAVTGRNLFHPHHFEFSRNGFLPVGIRRSLYASVMWQR